MKFWNVKGRQWDAWAFFPFNLVALCSPPLPESRYTCFARNPIFSDHLVKCPQALAWTVKPWILPWLLSGDLSVFISPHYALQTWEASGCVSGIQGLAIHGLRCFPINKNRLPIIPGILNTGTATLKQPELPAAAMVSRLLVASWNKRLVESLEFTHVYL